MALKQFQDDADYYTKPVTPLFAAKIWREIAANVGSRNQPAAEQAHVIQAFATDCVEVGWSEYTLQRAAVAWRRSAERFMPTFGQLRACVKEAGQKGGPTHYAEMLDMLKRAAGEAKPKSDTPPSMDEDELRARIKRMKQERVNGFKIVHDKRRDWTKIDEIMLKGMQEKLSSMVAS